MFWFNMCMCALLLRIVTWKLQKGHRSQLSDINKLTLSPHGFFFSLKCYQAVWIGFPVCLTDFDCVLSSVNQATFRCGQHYQ